MEDIVVRLRRAYAGLCTEDPYDYAAHHVSAGDCLEAADEIDRLRSIINRAGALACQNASQNHIRETLAEIDK